MCELPCDAHRGSVTRIGEVHGVGKVHRCRDAVDDDEEPSGHSLPAARLLESQRKEHHQGIEGVGIKYGRGIEGKAAFEQVAKGELVELRSEHLPVEPYKLQPAQGVDDVCEEEIECQYEGIRQVGSLKKMQDASVFHYCLGKGGGERRLYTHRESNPDLGNRNPLF